MGLLALSIISILTTVRGYLPTEVSNVGEDKMGKEIHYRMFVANLARRSINAWGFWLQQNIEIDQGINY